MKAKHRHDLKTNALADWLSNLPQWAGENLASVIIVVVTIIAVAGFFLWRSYTRNARLQEQYHFTGIVNQIANRKMRILGAQGQGSAGSSLLFEPARNLETFAKSTDDDNLAALALIKEAEALRSELHYRTDSVSTQDMAAQMDRAKQSYAVAAQKASDNPSLRAAAQFGLGLCAEDLGNFDEARQIYTEIADNPAFEGTVSVAQAKLRLETMADYKGSVVFAPKPKPKPTKIEPVTIDLKPTDANSTSAAAAPIVRVGPVDINAPAVIKRPVPEPNKPVTTPEIKAAPVEPNTPDAKAPAVTSPSVVEPNVPAGTPASQPASHDPNTAPKPTDPNVS